MTVIFITVTLIELFNVSNSILSTVHIRMSDIECDFSLTHRACNYAAIQLFHCRYNCHHKLCKDIV